MKVTSRPLGNQGTGINVEDGDVSDLEPEGMAEGTSISVRGLFANQPARLAFQRRPATETAQVVDVVVSHALCNPNVAFNLNVDGRQILETPSTDDMRDRLYDLLGASSEGMIALTSPDADKDAPGDEKWSGWISPPSISRGRSDDVHIIINGRPVAAQPFLQSIRRGYHTRLMVGRHPVAVLILELPADEVDVNVHPTKREVRLRNSWRVLERLERAIKETLKQVPTGSPATEDFPLGAANLLSLEGLGTHLAGPHLHPKSIPPFKPHFIKGLKLMRKWKKNPVPFQHLRHRKRRYLDLINLQHHLHFLVPRENYTDTPAQAIQHPPWMNLHY